MRSNEIKAENRGRNEIAKTEVARKTMVKIVVLVRNLLLSGIVRVLAFVLCELGEDVLERMHRLEHNRRHNRNQQRPIQQGKPLFHPDKNKETPKRNPFGLTNFCQIKRITIF